MEVNGSRNLPLEGRLLIFHKIYVCQYLGLPLPMGVLIVLKVIVPLRRYYSLKRGTIYCSCGRSCLTGVARASADRGLSLSNSTHHNSGPLPKFSTLWRFLFPGKMASEREPTHEASNHLFRNPTGNVAVYGCCTPRWGRLHQLVRLCICSCTPSCI